MASIKIRKMKESPTSHNPAFPFHVRKCLEEKKSQLAVAEAKAVAAKPEEEKLLEDARRVEQAQVPLGGGGDKKY